MTKRSTILIALAALMAGAPAASASHLTPEQALSRVGQSGMRHIAAANASAQWQYSATMGHLYVFNAADAGNGFLLLPDDDRAAPVLGYSDSGQLSADGNPALAAWLAFYNSELQQLDKTAPRQSTPQLRHMPRKTAREAISPLIQTEWNQEAPYNLLCPKVNGHEVVTGCVATAMAQFMKFYNYPAKGKGTHSYYWEVGQETLSLDYDTIPFQWDLMTDIYDAESTPEAKHAVAQLMVACGISVDMHYDIGDSGAATTKMGAQLIETFDYSPSLWMPQRNYYGYDEWVDMIYDQLAEDTPVLYSGQGTAGGHQFICDGYSSDDFFHFNWGWGGLSNGYFLLTALNPDDLGVGGGAGGFNTDQIATLGARPAQEGDKPTYVVCNSGAFEPEVASVSEGDDLQCSGTYFNLGLSTLPEGAVLGMKFTNAASGAVEYVRGPSVAGMKPDEGRYYDTVKFPALADGTYVITPALYAADKWWDVRMPLGNAASITATVAAGTATLTSAQSASVTVADIVVPATVYAGHDFPMQFTAYNSSSTLEFYGNVTPYLLDESGNVVASSNYRPLDVMPGASEAVTDYVANFAAVDGATFGAGQYQLVFCDDDYNQLSQPVAVNVETTSETTEISVSDFRLVTAPPVTDPTTVEFSFTVTCESGVYYGCPRVIIFPGDGGYEQAALSGNSRYLATGESAAVTVSGSLDQLKDGAYMAAAYENGEAKTDYIRFEIRRPVGIDVPVADPTAAPASIYTLDGRRHTSADSPGIYIIDGHTILKR